MADDGCSRLVFVGPDGKVTERELGNLHPYALLARADGSLWFAAENPGEGGTVYRVGPDGAITPFDVPRPPADLAEAPDGAVWAADGTGCQAVPPHVRSGGATAGTCSRPVSCASRPTAVCG